MIDRSEAPAVIPLTPQAIRKIGHRYRQGGLESALYERQRPGAATVLDDGQKQRIIAMVDGRRILTIPRHDPVDALTMGGIVRDAGLTPEQFRDLLWPGLEEEAWGRNLRKVSLPLARSERIAFLRRDYR